jgi:hypothetical protein
VAHVRKRNGRYQVVGGPKGTTRTFLRQGDAKTYLADLESRRRLGSLYREQPVLFGEEAEGWRERQKVGPATRKLYRAACNSLSPLDSLYVNQVTVRAADDLISKKARTASASARLALTVL